MVTVEYELKDANGSVLSSSSETGLMRFIFGAGQVFPAIEQARAGLEPAAHVAKAVSAAEGFGERDESRVIEVPRSQLPPDVAVGTMVSAQDQQGRRIPLMVIHLDETTARLDGNHPLAGKALVFKLTVKSVEGIKEVGS